MCHHYKSCYVYILFYNKIYMPSTSYRSLPLPQCTENPIYVFPEMKLLGLAPNSYIHASLSNLYIPRIGLPIWLQQNRRTDPGNIYSRVGNGTSIPKKFREIDSERFPLFRGRKCCFRGIPGSAEEPIPRLGTELNGM
jgi:hypothetical protein